MHFYVQPLLWFLRQVPQSHVMFSISFHCDLGLFLSPFSYILRNSFRRSRNLLRSYSGECLGSSSDEERSELRYAIWIAEFRELLDLWTHAAFWGNPVCSFTGVFNSFFRRGKFIKLVADLRAQLCFARLGTLNTSGASLRSMRVSTCLAHLVTAALVIHSCISSFYSSWLSSSCFGLTR